VKDGKIESHAAPGSALLDHTQQQPKRFLRRPQNILAFAFCYDVRAAAAGIFDGEEKILARSTNSEINF